MVSRFDDPVLRVDKISPRCPGGNSGRRRVAGFPVMEYWVDIGQLEDYHRALAEVEGEGV